MKDTGLREPYVVETIWAEGVTEPREGRSAHSRCWSQRQRSTRFEMPKTSLVCTFSCLLNLPPTHQSGVGCLFLRPLLAEGPLWDFSRGLPGFLTSSVSHPFFSFPASWMRGCQASHPTLRVSCDCDIRVGTLSQNPREQTCCRIKHFSDFGKIMVCLFYIM